MKIVVAGGSGFLGQTILKKLSGSGHSMVLLTRNPARSIHAVGPEIEIELWDGKNEGAWVASFEGAGAIINLAGASLAGRRWTKNRKSRIVNSRINATKAIVRAIGVAKSKPALLINASAVGYYGSVPVGDVPETHPAGVGFVPDLCTAWEKEALVATAYETRVALLRLGVVLAATGGALQKMVPPFKFFVGGHFGTGEQWFPWIHQRDVASIVEYVLQTEELSGPINVVAPECVTNLSFSRSLAKALHRPSWLPVPEFAMRTILGEMSEMLLTGQKVIPSKLEKHGYRFQFPQLDAALNDILQ